MNIILKIFQFVIFSIISTNVFSIENETALYKCMNNKSFIYYQKINNSGNYNGWFEIIGLECLNISQIQVFCKNSKLVTDYNNIEYNINEINCSDFKLNYPAPSYPENNSIINLQFN